jgi:hypothetical protein
MQIPESISRFCQNVGHHISTAATSTKNAFCKAGSYVVDVASRVHKAVGPHLHKAKETSLRFFRENKMEIGIAAGALAVGAAIGFGLSRALSGNKSEKENLDDKEVDEIEMDEIQ